VPPGFRVIERGLARARRSLLDENLVVNDVTITAAARSAMTALIRRLRESDAPPMRSPWFSACYIILLLGRPPTDDEW
jgi:hypothetical protein